MTVEIASTVLLAFGCLSAVIGVRTGNRTAGALLASALYSSFLCWIGVPFNPMLWLAVDLVVIMWIVIGWVDELGHGRYGKRRDIAILALFGLIWPIYFTRPAWGHEAVDTLVGLQMLGTFPFRGAWNRGVNILSRSNDDQTMKLAMA